MQKNTITQIKNKVEKVINSCKTVEHLQVAENYLDLFNMMYHDMVFYLEMYLKIKETKTNFKENGVN